MGSLLSSGTGAAHYKQSWGPKTDFIHLHSGNIKLMNQWKESKTLPNYFPDGKDDIPDSGKTALMVQAQQSSDDVETLTFLLQQKADPNLRANNGDSALHFAITSGDHPQKVLLLLQHGADPAIANNWGKTPLELARFHKRSQCIAILTSWPEASAGRQTDPCA